MIWRYVGLLTCLNLVSCAEDPESLISPPVAEKTSGRVAPSPWTLDDEFARIARDVVPGFAGRYLDESGAHVVLITDPSRSDEARAYVEDYRRSRGFAPDQWTLRVVQYDAIELLGWKLAVRSLLARGLIVGLDIDEVNNRLTVGAVEPNMGNVAALVSGLGVPVEAFIVRPDRPSEFTATLQDRYRPVTPGYQIQNDNGATCTAGMNAYYAGERVLITASHCTLNEFSSPDFGIMYQNTDAPGNRIGVELRDTPPYSCDPFGFAAPCRWSDAAYIEYDDSVAWRRAGLARLMPGGLVDQSSYIPIDKGILSWNDIEVGMVIWVTGRTSGVKKANINNTCEDRSTGSPAVNLLCQVRAYKNTVQNGDSGGPVWYGDTYFVGIVWGGGIESGVPFLHFSPAANIWADLDGFTL